MNNEITISLNPTYLCNLRCEFCYLSKEQLGNTEIISPERLFNLLSDISTHRNITKVDVYGGEVAMIPDDKMVNLLNTAKLFFSGQFNIISNFTKVPDYFYREDVMISVSWDYFVRNKNEQVYQNMLEFKRPIHILMLASEPLLKLDQNEVSVIIKLLNAIPMLKTFEIKPYSRSLYNAQKNDFEAFERWVQYWINLRHEMGFQFVNIDKIVEAHESLSSSWSDDHLYIKPNGSLAVLDFDQDGKEYFGELRNFEAYEAWCQNEKQKFKQDKICGQCKYLGHCLSEHLQIVDPVNNSCSGFFNLLENNLELVNEYN